MKAALVLTAWNRSDHKNNDESSQSSDSVKFLESENQESCPELGCIKTPERGISDPIFPSSDRARLLAKENPADELKSRVATADEASNSELRGQTRVTGSCADSESSYLSKGQAAPTPPS